jgi:hypothetical protein
LKLSLAGNVVKRQKKKKCPKMAEKWPKNDRKMAEAKAKKKPG